MPRARSTAPLPLLVLALLMLVWAGSPACGPDAGAPAAVAVAAEPARLLSGPEFSEECAAIEAGRGELALALLEGVQGLAAACLRARAELLLGHAVEAMAEVEKARALAPLHPEVFGTEVEILAQLDRLEGAAEVLARGRLRCGSAPELLRAQGSIELRIQGHGEQALEALERARAKDPALPFLKWPLAQAHLLVGRARIEKSPAEAVVHARAARLLEPELSDALELEAEALAIDLRFEEAIALYEELEARGRDYGETPAILHQKCATRCLLQRDRAGAIEHYLAARARGLCDAELGFGADLLSGEKNAALERGLRAGEQDDWATAEREYARALELAPGDLESEQALGVARFSREDYSGAAAAWEAVLAGAQARGAELGPLGDLPLDLAKAWRLSGEPDRARAVLTALLDRDPAGPLCEPARELLVALEAEALAPK